MPDFVRRIPEGDNRERLVCAPCGYIAYENPKVVVGSVIVADGAVLLCRRAIEPRRGFWTLPAGYLELGETLEEGAAREAMEEAQAAIAIEGILAVYSIARIGQVQVIFRARFAEPGSSAGGPLAAPSDIPVGTPLGTPLGAPPGAPTGVLTGGSMGTPLAAPPMPSLGAAFGAPRFAAGPESLEVALYAWDDIPWPQIAFPSVRWALQAWREVGAGRLGVPAGNPPEDHRGVRRLDAGGTGPGL